MPTHLHLSLEVSGCPTACMHCWANGGAYRPMPLADVEWVLVQGQRFCHEEGLSFAPYAMHEVLAHPQAAEVLQRLIAINATELEPLPTTGVPLATRPDWQDLLATIRELGIKTLWFTFHGVGAVHDRAVNREGAFEESCLAVERAHAAGFRCGCNVFATKEALAQFDALVQRLHDLPLDETGWEVARYHPIPRRRLSERSRPELTDLAPYAGEIAASSIFWRDKWRSLADRTESAYVDRALHEITVEEDPWQWPASPDHVSVVCRPNLDVYSGIAGTYGRCHGNLREDGADAVLKRALEYGSVSADALYFATDAVPPVSELAAQVGATDGTRIYFTAAEMRLRWLDLALAGRRLDESLSGRPL
jgi:hypothetical protein